MVGGDEGGGGKGSIYDDYIVTLGVGKKEGCPCDLPPGQ